MPKKEPIKFHKGDDGKRYLKKFEIVETEVELPIQGQVRDPEDLFKFLKDLESESVSKVIGIYLDQNNLFLGHRINSHQLCTMKIVYIIHKNVKK